MIFRLSNHQFFVDDERFSANGGDVQTC
jgi:hypothetical protein